MKFLDKIDHGTKQEAIRRLRVANYEAMAEALEAYESSAQTSQGWDESVSGEDGELYKQFGSTMRETIWPYKFKKSED